jgi:hypothetical protein
MTSETPSTFTAFRGDSEEIDVPDDYVIEVLDCNGKIELFYRRPRKRITFRLDRKYMYFDESIPLYRLYIRDNNYPDMLYKIPVNLPVENRMRKVYIPDAGESTQLWGDEYFMMIYEISNR